MGKVEVNTMYEAGRSQDDKVIADWIKEKYCELIEDQINTRSFMNAWDEFREKVLDQVRSSIPQPTDMVGMTEEEWSDWIDEQTHEIMYQTLRDDAGMTWMRG